MLAVAAPPLDVLDPLSTNAIELTVTDPLASGAAVTTATVTVLLTRADGTALGSPLGVALSMAHVASGLYRVLIPPASLASAGIDPSAPGHLRLTYTATITGTSPLVTAVLRQRVQIARRIDT